MSLRISIHRAPERFGRVSIQAWKLTPGGKTLHLTIEVKAAEVAEGHAAPGVSGELSVPEFRELVKAFQEALIESGDLPDPRRAEGRLEAALDHLQDMRALVFNDHLVPPRPGVDLEDPAPRRKVRRG